MRRRHAPGGNGHQGRDDLEGDAREERWRESERGRGSSTFASFDERLARTRARAESAREDAVRIERWLRERSAAARTRWAAIAKVDEQLFMDEDAQDGARRMEAVYQRSPTRSVIHRPIPSRPLSFERGGARGGPRRGRAGRRLGNSVRRIRCAAKRIVEAHFNL